MNLQLLLTGNELMAGQTVDSNSAMIANQLASVGFSIDRKVTLGDEFDRLVSELDAMSAQSDVLIVNGGLGPTVDDLTAAALAKLAAVELEEHPEAVGHLQNWCKRRGIKLNNSNLKQAWLPSGVTIIPNPTGSAVGFSLLHNDCLIICTPGVPSELQRMMEDTVLTTLADRFPNHRPQTTLRFQTFGLGESTVQQLILNELADWPKEVELGFRAGLPQLELKLKVADGPDNQLLTFCKDKLYSLIGDYILGTDNTTLAGAVIELLKQQGMSVTTAESCTGGLIAANITEVAGASAAFEAGFVTYSNAMKTAILGVSEEQLITHGAVSEAVVIDMVQGALQRSGADYGIAVSGIAGPDGGTEEKPVGSVWIAWGSAQRIQTRYLYFPGSRRWFQTMVAAAGLDLIRRELLGITELPRYFRQRAANTGSSKNQHRQTR